MFNFVPSLINMKVVNIIGGLGNQLFQYAFAIALQMEFPEEEVKICIKSFNGYPLHNGYELDDLFTVSLRKASFWDLCKVAYPWIHYRLWQIGNKIFPKRKTMLFEKDIKYPFCWEDIKKKNYFEGYWGSEIYFSKYKKAIQKSFNFNEINDKKNLNAMSFIKNKPTAFIHVRRGDYVNNPEFDGICTLEYYSKAISILKRDYNFNRFVIFSNDIPWCKENLTKYLTDSELLFIDWNKGKVSNIDMQLMTYCQGGIIANSTFSWWGAWLGEHSVIISPSKWKNNTIMLPDIIPDSWIKIQV